MLYNVSQRKKKKFGMKVDITKRLKIQKKKKENEVEDKHVRNSFELGAGAASSAYTRWCQERGQVMTSSKDRNHF